MVMVLGHDAPGVRGDTDASRLLLLVLKLRIGPKAMALVLPRGQSVLILSLGCLGTSYISAPVRRRTEVIWREF